MNTKKAHTLTKDRFARSFLMLLSNSVAVRRLFADTEQKRMKLAGIEPSNLMRENCSSSRMPCVWTGCFQEKTQPVHPQTPHQPSNAVGLRRGGKSTTAGSRPATPRLAKPVSVSRRTNLARCPRSLHTPFGREESCSALTLRQPADASRLWQATIFVRTHRPARLAWRGWSGRRPTAVPTATFPAPFVAVGKVCRQRRHGLYSLSHEVSVFSSGDFLPVTNI